jgi:hypothetical protein
MSEFTAHPEKKNFPRTTAGETPSRPDPHSGRERGEKPDGRGEARRGPSQYGRGDRRREQAAPEGEGRERERGSGRREHGGAARADGREFSRTLEDPRLRGAAAALIALDRDLMKLLVRRAVLVSRIRGGRDHAASPETIQAEKAVRTAWESGALAFSRDPRFIRQLFTLLQDVQVLSKEGAENAGIFTLAPPRQAVSGELTGPADARDAQMRLALAACRGDALIFDAVPFSEAFLDTARVCAQAGAALTRQARGAGPGRIVLERGGPLSFAGKSLYVGEDAFTLHLMAFLAAGRPGSCRLNGGARLKAADLSSLRNALPLFGARLAPVVPRSQGLPVSLEFSGELPPQALIPADLPLEAVCALLLAPLLWNVPISLNLAALPAATATAALARVGPVHLACGAQVDNRGSCLTYSPAALDLPEKPALTLDPALSAYLLALPAFAGGSLILKGRWPSDLPDSLEAEALLSWAGLGLRIGKDEVAAEATPRPFARPPQCHSLSPELVPLFLALAAKGRTLGARTPPLRQLASVPADGAQDDLAREFCERLGLTWEDGRLPAAGQGGEPRLAADDPIRSAWISPDAYWSMAFALGAFVRPGLRLANPGGVNAVMPSFWSIYNSLPHPFDPLPRKRETAQEPPDDKSPGRRVIVG